MCIVHASVPVAFSTMQLEQLESIWGLSEDQVRTRLLHYALEYAESRILSLADCGLRVIAGKQWMYENRCVLEVTDSSIRERFGFSRFYTYVGPTPSGEGTADLTIVCGFESQEDAHEAFLALLQEVT